MINQELTGSLIITTFPAYYRPQGDAQPLFFEMTPQEVEMVVMALHSYQRSVPNCHSQTGKYPQCHSDS